ncbi:hypothetical protein C8R44DRAFT_911659 [Mycena epipterygia]|nr:hypothetical protein C8R44DRAFT_911659 [Mycena epipterygia]
MMSRELPASVALAGLWAGADTAQPPELPTGSSHLLESNDPHLDSEIPAIHQIIVTHACVEVLDSQIEILRTTMEQLVAEHNKWQECVWKHTAVMALLRHVPSELICEIFALTLLHTRRFDGFSSIELSNEHHHFYLRNHPLSVINTQLLQSRNVPLTVNFDSWDCEDAVEYLLWDFLLPQCDRWSTICLQCQGDLWALSNLLNAIWGHIPQLKKLELVRVLGSINLSTESSSFFISPNLQQIILTDPEYLTISPPICIPWAQITHYRGRPYPACCSVASALLATCLIYLTIKLLLFLIFGGYTWQTVVLSYLTAPVLQALHTHGRVQSTLDFVNRFGCRLTKLVLEACEPVDALVHVFSNLPFVEYLLIESCRWDSTTSDTFFNTMRILGASSDLCPCLTSLAYGQFYLGLLRDDLLAMVPMVAMAQSHLYPNSPCRLSSLQFFSHQINAQNPIKEETQILADQGLDIVFLCSKEVGTLIANGHP